jgi:hypothetical protein
MIWTLLSLAIAGSPFDAPETPSLLAHTALPYRLEADPRATVIPGNDKVEAMVAAADGYLGHPWLWSGRDTLRLPGVDCLGLLFLSHGEVTGQRWTVYPHDPSPLVLSGKLGAPVPGLQGATRAEVDRTTLERGDVLYFLVEGYEIADEPLYEEGDGRYWPWHTGLFVGEGAEWVLNAHPRYGVVRMKLDDIEWDRLLVTRPFPE